MGTQHLEAAEAVRKAESKSANLRRVAADVNSLVSSKPMVHVGELDLRQQGLLTDTTFLFGNGPEGGVAMEPEAVFHGWRLA